MTDRAIAADVEDLAITRIAGARPQECIRGVVDIHEIAQLTTIPVNLNRSTFDREANEPANETLTIVSNQLAGTVHISQAQRAGADAEDVVVDEMVILAGSLVDAVDVRGQHEMGL